MSEDDKQIVEGEKAKMQVDFFQKIASLASLGYQTIFTLQEYGQGVNVILRYDQ